MDKIDLADRSQEFRGGGEYPLRGRVSRVSLGASGVQSGNGSEDAIPSSLLTRQPARAGFLPSNHCRACMRPFRVYASRPVLMGVAFVVGFGAGAAWGLHIMLGAVS